MKKADLDLYTDYLLSTFGVATGLSAMLDGDVSHDRITRFLSAQEYTSRDLWQLVKPTARSLESDEGVLIFDDTIQEEEQAFCAGRYQHNMQGVMPITSPPPKKSAPAVASMAISQARYRGIQNA